MMCSICVQALNGEVASFDGTVAGLDAHLDQYHPWHRNAKLASKTPIFIVVYGDGQYRLVAYVGEDEDRARDELDEIVAEDRYGTYLQKNGKTIATRVTSNGVGVDQSESPLRQKGRMTFAPVVTVDPHKNCSYVGRCMANFLDPHVRACR